jgi:hypothetical protein
MKNKNDLYNGLSIELSDECILLNDLSPVNLSDEGIFLNELATISKTSDLFNSSSVSSSSKTSSESETKCAFIFSTCNSVSTNNFIGIGNSSKSFLKNTIVIPFNCIINEIFFSIRELSNNTSYSIIIYKNNINTGILAYIPNGSISYNTSLICNLELNTFDLISIKILFEADSLLNGACASLIYSLK